MDSIIKSDIFFFITGLSVIVLTIVGLVVLYYLTKIFKDIKHIAKTAKTEADHIAEDVETYRKDLKEGEKEIKQFAHQIKKIVKWAFSN